MIIVSECIVADDMLEGVFGDQFTGATTGIAVEFYGESEREGKTAVQSLTHIPCEAVFQLRIKQQCAGGDGRCEVNKFRRIVGPDGQGRKKEGEKKQEGCNSEHVCFSPDMGGIIR